jgi:hypothetical protein
LENRKQKKKVYGPHHAYDIYGRLSWMVDVKALLQSIILLLLALLPIEILAHKPKDIGFGSIAYFSCLEGCVNNLADGKSIFNSLVAHLQPSFLNMEEAYFYALCAIEESDVPVSIKEKLAFVINSLLFEHLSISDIADTEQQDIPGSLILGGVEILVGSLVHLLPGCGWLGKLIIADGIRRGFNGLEEMDDHNKKESRKFPSSMSLRIPMISLHRFS